MPKDAWIIVAASLAVALVGAANAQAQLEVPPTAFGWRQRVPPHLIVNDAVQKDLGLSAESIDKLTRLSETIKAETRAEVEKLGLPATRRQEIFKKSQETARNVQAAYYSKLVEILSPQQQIRFEQIHLQVEVQARGEQLSVLSDPTVAEALELSADQQNRILSANREFITNQGRAYKSVPRGDIGKKVQELKNMRDEELDGVLSADQKAAFEALRGKPFDATPRRR